MKSLPVALAVACTLAIPSPCAWAQSANNNNTPVTVSGPANSQVTTGGTPVNAFNALGVNAGGVISNPVTATQNLCIAVGAPAGTASLGLTICIPPNYSLQIPRTSQYVSVNSTDNNHAFSAWGFQ